MNLVKFSSVFMLQYKGLNSFNKALGHVILEDLYRDDNERGCSRGRI